MSDELVEKVARMLCDMWDDDWISGRGFHKANAAKIIAACQSEPPALLPALLVVREAFADGVSDLMDAARITVLMQYRGHVSTLYFLAMLDAAIEEAKAEGGA